ncbi:hypothetical protein HX776_06875 [Pseudomonas agarici]|uniref:DUF2515 family protein n=1 Tax=Pseudomonas agarici TaxID=46677 RepID=UPI0008B8DE2B|nr:hypothetical protein [Pseudomonas agarici]NWC08546.1 hypothetical protein [Pseudomonas agarici]SEL24280.1 hypothetical protein SAMN05216604_11415 [Pseudomonas agarici]
MIRPWIVDTEEGVTYIKGRILKKAYTRAEAGATEDAIATCNDLWSLVQSQSIALLAENNTLVSDVLRRSKRTAGNYAQLFLDDEGTQQQGRFYWAGLAAFAAKQVVDGIEFAETKFDEVVGQARLMSRVTYYYLLKGNFWVFLEITPWMLYWRKFGREAFFRDIDCRDVTTYDPVITEQVQSMPWAMGENTSLRLDLEKKMRVLDLRKLNWEMNLTDDKGALAEMNQCRATDDLKNGFREVERYEVLPDKNDEEKKIKYDTAHSSAQYFLNHEQNHHLQVMVYDHPEFIRAIDNNDLGRRLWNLLGAKDPSLVFNAAPMITREIEVRELEPYGLTEKDVTVTMELAHGKLYNPEQRMKYVKKILSQYHKLMTEGRDFDGQFRLYMIEQMQVIAAWKEA